MYPAKRSKQKGRGGRLLPSSGSDSGSGGGASAKYFLQEVIHPKPSTLLLYANPFAISSGQGTPSPVLWKLKPWA